MMGNQDRANATPASNRRARAPTCIVHRVAPAIGVACLALFTMVGCVAHAQSPEAAWLAAQHTSLQGRMAASQFGRPLVIDSTEDGERVHGTIYGELAHPFAPLAERLTLPAEWCAVVRLHINVKACTYEHTADGDFLTIYSGRKFYQPIARAYPIRYRFRVAAVRSDYVRIALTAPEGPFGTGDYALELEATPVGARSFVVLRYGFRTSTASRLTVSTYLATSGSGKVGFTTTGRDPAGRRLLVGGLRGLVERNAMRNFLALDAWLDSFDAPATERFEHSVRHMTMLTGQYPDQLVEMPATDYQAIKLREWREQLDRAVSAVDVTSSQARGTNSERVNPDSYRSCTAPMQRDPYCSAGANISGAEQD